MISPDIYPDKNPDIFKKGRTNRTQGPGQKAGHLWVYISTIYTQMSGLLVPGHFCGHAWLRLIALTQLVIGLIVETAERG